MGDFMADGLRKARAWIGHFADPCRKRLATRLRRTARRLDPGHPELVANLDGSFEIKMGGFPIARISPGMVDDRRLRSMPR